MSVVKLNLGPLNEQPVLLTAEPSPAPLSLFVSVVIGRYWCRAGVQHSDRVLARDAHGPGFNFQKSEVGRGKVGKEKKRKSEKGGGRMEGRRREEEKRERGREERERGEGKRSSEGSWEDAWNWRHQKERQTRMPKTSTVHDSREKIARSTARGRKETQQQVPRTEKTTGAKPCESQAD